MSGGGPDTMEVLAALYIPALTFVSRHSGNYNFTLQSLETIFGQEATINADINRGYADCLFHLAHAVPDTFPSIQIPDITSYTPTQMVRYTLSHPVIVQIRAGIRLTFHYFAKFLLFVKDVAEDIILTNTYDSLLAVVHNTHGLTTALLNFFPPLNYGWNRISDFPRDLLTVEVNSTNSAAAGEAAEEAAEEATTAVAAAAEAPQLDLSRIMSLMAEGSRSYQDRVAAEAVAAAEAAVEAAATGDRLIDVRDEIDESPPHNQAVCSCSSPWMS